MRFRGKYSAALAVLFAAQPALADNPKKVAIGPGSAKGALLFNTAPYPAHQLLLLVREDGAGSSTHWIGIKARTIAEGGRFVVETLPPGRYFLEAVYQQNKWAACLDAATLILSIEPGKIAYLGMMDTRPTLASIQRSARASGNVKAETFQWHFFRKDIAVPRISDRDPEGLARAAGFVTQHMPKSKATPTLAELEWGPLARSGKPSGRADRCR